jgi:hypothetical protein
MSERTISEKLLLKPGRTLLVLNAPAGYLEKLSPLPDFAKIVTTEPADVVQLFVRSYAQLQAELPGAKKRCTPATVFWVCYPKQTGAYKTDINSDILAVYAATMSWKGNGTCSIDADWSAMRFKPQ